MNDQTERLEDIYLAALKRQKDAITETQKRAANWDVVKAWMNLEEYKAMTNQNNEKQNQ